MNESGTDEAECHRKVESRRRGAGAIKFLVNARGLSLECSRVCRIYCLCLFLYIVKRQLYERKRRRLGLRLYR